MLIRASVAKARAALGETTLLEEHLVDLMHWARVHEVPFETSITEAQNLYDDELRGVF